MKMWHGWFSYIHITQSPVWDRVFTALHPTEDGSESVIEYKQ